MGEDVFKSSAAARLDSRGMAFPLTEIYDEHAQALYAFLLNITRCEAETRDILQELFARLAARPPDAATLRNPRSYLICLSHRLAIDQHRRRSTSQRTEERFADERAHVFAATADPDEQAFRTALADALGDLPEEQRAVVHLKLWEEMTFAEIAEALAISPNTAASRYRYGLDKLQTLLRPLYEELR
jgi:RNA polymerase sigma-70 factor (ECF subfamily)